MKICFIVGSFPHMSCGVGDYTFQVASALSDLGNDISVITSVDANKDVDSMHIYNIIDKFDKNSISTIIKKIVEINPDIVHIQYPSHGFYNRKITSVLLPLAIKSRLRNVKLIETIHEYPKYSWKGRIFYSINYKCMDRIIVVEDYYKDLMERDFKFYKKLNLTTIKIGSNIPASKLTDSEKKTLRKKMNLDSSKVISFFGFARKNKGIEDILEALKKLDKEDVKFLFIGNLDPNNSYHAEILKYISDNRLSNKVIITGFIVNDSDVADYLAISDICILPYKDGVKERYGSFLAACMQNIKIITTSLENKPDEPGIYYIVPDNVDELVLKIKSVLESNEISIKKVNNWSEIASEYLDVYNGITK